MIQWPLVVQRAMAVNPPIVAKTRTRQALRSGARAVTRPGRCCPRIPTGRETYLSLRKTWMCPKAARSVGFGEIPKSVPS